MDTKIEINVYDFSKISSMEVLDSLLESYINNENITDYELKELHQFVMILPGGDGSIQNDPSGLGFKKYK